MAFAAFATTEAQPQAPKRKSRIALFLLLPGILYLVLFFLTPLISLTLTSLQVPSEFGDIGQFDYAFNWQNYVDVVQLYWPHILRSFGYALVATVLVFAQNVGMGPVAAVGDDVWVSWDVEHGFGLDDDPAEAGRFPADDSTRSIAVQQREALVTELEEN